MYRTFGSGGIYRHCHSKIFEIKNERIILLIMENKDTFLFDRRKYLVLIAGLVMLAIGFALMLGGGSEAPDEFNEEIFGTQRIGVAPWFIFIGLLLPIAAIMMKKKED